MGLNGLQIRAGPSIRFRRGVRRPSSAPICLDLTTTQLNESFRGACLVLRVDVGGTKEPLLRPLDIAGIKESVRIRVPQARAPRLWMPCQFRDSQSHQGSFVLAQVSAGTRDDEPPLCTTGGGGGRGFPCPPPLGRAG